MMRSGSDLVLTPAEAGVGRCHKNFRQVSAGVSSCQAGAGLPLSLVLLSMSGDGLVQCNPALSQTAEELMSKNFTVPGMEPRALHIEAMYLYN